MANILEPVYAAIAALEKRVVKLESAKPQKAPKPQGVEPTEDAKAPTEEMPTIKVPWRKRER